MLDNKRGKSKMKAMNGLHIVMAIDKTSGKIQHIPNVGAGAPHSSNRHHDIWCCHQKKVSQPGFSLIRS